MLRHQEPLSASQTAFVILEALERRTLLSTVYDVDLIGRETIGTGSNFDELRGRLLDNGSILYFGSNELVTASALGEPSMVRDLGNFYGTRAAFSSTGMAAIAGSWGVQGGLLNPNSGLRGVGIFPADASVPSRVIYGDTSAPTAFILDYGTLSPSSLTYRVSVLYEDELLDATTLTGSELVLSVNGTPIYGTKSWSDGNFDSPYRIAEYSFNLPQPSQSGQTYSINVVANAVRDKVGRGVAASSLSFTLWPAGTTSSNPTFVHRADPLGWAPQPLPWPVQPLKDLALEGEMLLQRDGAIVARAQVGPTGAEQESIVWITAAGVQSCNISGVPGGRLASLSEFGGVAVLTSSAGDLLLARPNQGPALRMSASAAGLTDVRRPVIDNWGSLIAFQAKRSGAPAIASHGLYVATSTILPDGGGGWAVRRLLPEAGDGVLDDGETWADKNTNDILEAGEDLQPDTTDVGDQNPWGPLDKTMGLITEPEQLSGSQKLWRVVYQTGENSVMALAIKVQSTAPYLTAGFPEVVLSSSVYIDPFDQPNIPPQMHFGLFVGATQASSASMAIGGVIFADLLDSPVNSSGAIAVSLSGPDAHAQFAKALNLGVRPVLLVPGVFGCLPQNDYLSDWLTHLGYAPDRFVIDPMAQTYDTLIKSFRDAGYRLDGAADVPAGQCNALHR